MRARAAPAALAALVVVWWWARFTDRGDVVDLDAILYFLPTYAATWERLRAGIVPLWNPYQLCGIPWIGTLQGGTFYPLHVVYAFLPLNVGLAVLGVVHLVIAATATACFVRRLGLGYAAALLAAVVFTLRGQVAFALPAPNFLEAVAWLPVGAVALVDLVLAPSRRPVALLGAATAASLLAGYPQPTVYVIYAWGSLFLALLIDQRPSLRGIVGRTAAFAGALVLGAAISGVQMLPALELLRVGTRAPGGLTDQTMFPLSPTVTPALYMLRFQSISGTLFAFGVIALALVPAAPLAPRGRVVGWWALAVTVLSAAWSLGRYTPLFDLYLALPALRLFRNPSRLFFVTDFAVAIAAALGLSAVIGNTADRRRPVAPPALAAVALAGVILLARRGWASEDATSLVRAFAAVGATGLVALAASRGPSRPIVGAAIALAAVIEIACNPWFKIRLPYAAADLAPYDTLGAELRELAAVAQHDRVWRALTGINLEHTLKLSTWHRLRTISDYEPVNLQRQSDFFTYFADGSTTATRRPWLFPGDAGNLNAPPGGRPPARRRRLLDLAAVRYVTFGHGAILAPSTRKFIDQAGLVLRERTDHLLIFENPAALPRAYVTYRTTPAPDDLGELFATMSAPPFDPLEASFVEGPVPFVAKLGTRRGHPVTFVRDDETDVELEATLAQAGLVVLADSFYPGWRATVDGEPAPILATNHLFRGVPAPAGTHRIRFEYAPTSVRIGGLLSVTGVIVLVWLSIGISRTRP